MSVFNYFLKADMLSYKAWSAPITYNDSSLLSISSKTIYAEFTGSYKYNLQTLTGGTITDVILTSSGEDFLAISESTVKALELTNLYLLKQYKDVINLFLVKDDQIFGSDFDDKLYGLDGNDELHGNAGKDALYGGKGNDKLYGESGLDKFYGGEGNDTYYMTAADTPKSALDSIFENKDEGTDTVVSEISYTLGKNLENLKLSVDIPIAQQNINATGNELANTIVGNDGDNIINGKLGSDTLSGGLGADSFVFDTKFELDKAKKQLSVDHIKDFVTGEDVLVLSSKIFTIYAADVKNDAVDISGDFYSALGATPQTPNDHFVYDLKTGTLYYDPDGSKVGGIEALKIAIFDNKVDLSYSDIQIT